MAPVMGFSHVVNRTTLRPWSEHGNFRSVLERVSGARQLGCIRVNLL